MIETPKLAIIGAGAVGTSLAYAALIRATAREVAIYDHAREKVEAEVLDLAHGTQFTGGTISGGADLAVIEGAHLVVITAGAKQQPGQTRLDLAGTNVRMLETLLPQLLERAPEAIFLLVTNPVDVLTFAAQQITGLPAARVFGSGTVLDTSRLRWLLARRAGVATTSVHADIIGEHGDTEFPLWSQARIGPVPLLSWQSENPFAAAELDSLAAEIRDAAYAVIRGKGATNYAIGLAGARIAEAVLRDEQAVLPVSCLQNGLYGIDSVALSVPSRVGRDGAVPIAETPMSDEEVMRLHASADALRAAGTSLGL